MSCRKSIHSKIRRVVLEFAEQGRSGREPLTLAIHAYRDRCSQSVAEMVVRKLRECGLREETELGA